MKDKLHSHKVGVVLGSLFGLVHLLWSLLVFFGFAKPMVDWIMSLHFIGVSYSIMGFDPIKALVLILIATIWGYLVGYIFAQVWNRVLKR